MSGFYKDRALSSHFPKPTELFYKLVCKNKERQNKKRRTKRERAKSRLLQLNFRHFTTKNVNHKNTPMFPSKKRHFFCFFFLLFSKPKKSQKRPDPISNFARFEAKKKENFCSSKTAKVFLPQKFLRRRTEKIFLFIFFFCGIFFPLKLFLVQ